MSSSLILIVSILNCLSIGGAAMFLSALIRPFASILPMGAFGLLVVCMIWFIQQLLAMRILKSFERDKYAQAPFGKNPKI